MSATYLSKVSLPGQDVNPLFAMLGVEVVTISPEEAVLRLPFSPGFIQGGGVVAGGIMATLADEAMAHVVLANLAEGQATATVEMNVRYFKAVPSGALTASAVVVNKGGRVIAVEASITDERQRLVAKAGAQFFVLAPKS